MDRYRKQRTRMVETQIRARSISDPQLLKVMETIPRHLFVDEGLIDQAYSDNPLPIGEKQTISQPWGSEDMKWFRKSTRSLRKRKKYRLFDGQIQKTTHTDGGDPDSGPFNQ